MSQKETENRKDQEVQARKKENEEFNSITNKVKVENQNQRHNARKEGIGAIYKSRWNHPSALSLPNNRKRPYSLSFFI